MKLTLKSRLISKYSSCTFWIQPWFQKTSENFHLLTCEKISHPLNFSPVTSKVSMSERVNIIISNDPPVVVIWKGKFFLFSVKISCVWFVMIYNILFSYEVVVYLDLFLWKVSIWLTACQSNWQNSVNLIYSSSSYWQNSVNLIDSLSIKLLNQCLFDWRLVNKTVHLIDSLSIKLPNQCLFDWRLVNKIGTVLSIWLTAYQSNKWLCLFRTWKLQH